MARAAAAAAIPPRALEATRVVASGAQLLRAEWVRWMSAADTASGHLARWAWRWRRLQCWSSARRCCSCSICGGSSSCATCCACARAVAAGSTSAWLPVRLSWRRLCELRQLLPPCWSIARRCRYPNRGRSSSWATCRACALWLLQILWLGFRRGRPGAGPRELRRLLQLFQRWSLSALATTCRACARARAVAAAVSASGAADGGAGWVTAGCVRARSRARG